jgi:hypothetical protein
VEFLLVISCQYSKSFRFGDSKDFESSDKKCSILQGSHFGVQDLTHTVSFSKL